MSTVKGKVESLGTKKSGKWTVQTFVLGGVEYQYGVGKPPKFAVGDEISFEVEMKYNKPCVKFGTLKYSDAAETGPATDKATSTSGSSPSNAGGGSAKGYRKFPVPPRDGDRSIIRQNALSHATALVTTDTTVRGEPVDLTVAAEEVISVAKLFEAYSAGDQERHQDEAKAAQAVASKLVDAEAQ